MELETVEIKVEKGMIPDDVDIVVVRDVCTVEADAIVLGRIRDPGSTASDGFVVHVVSIEKKLKPEWKPPKLKKGWVTWDGNGGWWWWSDEPQYTDEYGWVDPSTGDGGDGEEIGEVMAEFLECPDCTGYDERNCIWEVGE